MCELDLRCEWPALLDLKELCSSVIVSDRQC